MSIDNVGVINKISISHEISKKMSLGYNLGYDYSGKERGDLTYSLCLGVNINKRSNIYLECYGLFKNIDNYVSDFDMGFTYLFRENLQFDFSFGFGLNEINNFISFGLSWLLF